RLRLALAEVRERPAVRREAEKFGRVGAVVFVLGITDTRSLGSLGCGEMISIRRRRVTEPPTEDGKAWLPGPYWPSALSRKSARPRCSRDRKDSPGRRTASLHS